MNNPYYVHSWSTQYREETLRDARTAHLEEQLREGRKARRGRGSLSLALAGVLSPVRGE